MNQPAAHYADRLNQKAANAVDVYLYERARGIRWASSVKHYGEDAAREYGDRFLIELIQNAYDANPKGSSAGKVSVLLDLGEGEHGVLYVANTGRPFSDENFDAITDIAQNDKEPGEGIGNKGVGFKSVLQVSQWPEIYSAQPDSKHVRRILLPASETNGRRSAGRREGPRDVLRDVPPYALPIPLHEVPTQVARFRQTGYYTVVRLPHDVERAARRVETEIGRLTASTTPLLLFLERTDLLHLRIDIADGLAQRDDRPHCHVKRMGKQDALDIGQVDLGEQGIFIIATRPVSGAAFSAAIADSATEISVRWASWKQDSTVSRCAATRSHRQRTARLHFLPMKIPRHPSLPM